MSALHQPQVKADTPTIAEALANVMQNVTHVAKRDFNSHAKYNFRGVDAVVNAVGPALRERGVIVVPELVSASYEIVQTTTGKPSTACRVVVAYVFYGPAGDSITASVAGEAWDSGDKATPKAMSVAYRTALLQTLALPTDEPDPDSHTYERAEDQSAVEVFELKKEIARLAGANKAQVAAEWLSDYDESITNTTDLDRLRAKRDEMRNQAVPS